MEIHQNDLKLTITTEINCPDIPEYVTTKNGSRISVSELTVEQLRDIASKWTDKLILKAKQNK